jgi:hypothetical protein
MHHIYPTRIAVNGARANSPYMEIADQQTQKWFFRNQVLTSIPASNIDAYSEQRTDAFEPRESVKGDLARSIFYFYTMYSAQANLADPIFFELQRNTLCQWAQQDPADSIELRKTWRIAPYQDGKPNPFVVDCTLANRCWCPEFPPNCLVSVETPGQATELGINIWPNPVHDQLYFKTTEGIRVSIRLLDLMGKVIIPAQSPATEGAIQLPRLPQGLYLLEATKGAGYKTLHPVLIQ